MRRYGDFPVVASLLLVVIALAASVFAYSFIMSTMLASWNPAITEDDYAKAIICAALHVYMEEYGLIR